MAKSAAVTTHGPMTYKDKSGKVRPASQFDNDPPFNPKGLLNQYSAAGKAALKKTGNAIAKMAARARLKKSA